MLREQIALLNYLEEQNNAIINGLAGTGKQSWPLKKQNTFRQGRQRLIPLLQRFS